jgi:transcriptional regulator with XRE-family HTH domain
LSVKGGGELKINKQKLKLAMAKCCLSMKELSKISGVSIITLARANNGRQEPRPITIGKIAKALNVDVSELIDE